MQLLLADTLSTSRAVPDSEMIIILRVHQVADHIICLPSTFFVTLRS